MRNLFAALRFLTVFPLPPNRGSDGPKELAGSLVFFPVVGMLIGGLAVGLVLGLSPILPPFPIAVLTVILLAAVSRGLHLDGLSDSADGLFSSRSRQRALEIMRDSRVGPMGVLAVVAVLLVKVAGLASLPTSKLWPAAFLMPLAGRCALVIGIALLPYVRPEDGLGKVFYAGNRMIGLVWSMGLLGLTSWLVAGIAGLTAAGGAMLTTLMVAAYIHRKIGGATGDTLGAGCEIAEAIPALVLAGWYFVHPG